MDPAPPSATWSAAIKGAVVNKWYWLRSTVGDMVSADQLFSKETSGEDINLAGGVVVKGEDEAELFGQLGNYTWFSYRNGFSGLPQELTYDTSWGCVHRTGQMLVMTALRRHCGATGPELVHLFKDLEVSPYSIQRIALSGAKYGYEPGQWFAPTVIAKVMRDLISRHMKDSPRPLTAIVAEDRTIPAIDVMSAASVGGVLLLIPSMFGIDLPIKPAYSALLLSHLASKYSVGVLGGKPRHALYFIGHRGDHVIVLDPHRVQPAYVDSDSLGATAQPRHVPVHVSELDTCCLMGYYAADVEEAKELLEFLVAKPAELTYSYFCVDSGKPSVSESASLRSVKSKKHRIRITAVPEKKGE